MFKSCSFFRTIADCVPGVANPQFETVIKAMKTYNFCKMPKVPKVDFNRVKQEQQKFLDLKRKRKKI
jgi:hypothetical protein